MSAALVALVISTGCASEALDESDVTLETTTALASHRGLFNPPPPRGTSTPNPRVLDPQAPVMASQCPDSEVYFVPDPSLQCAPVNSAGGVWTGELAAPGAGSNICRYRWLSLQGAKPMEHTLVGFAAKGGFPDCASNRGGIEALPESARPLAAPGSARAPAARDGTVSYTYPQPSQCPTCGVVSRGALVGFLKNDLAVNDVVDAFIFDPISRQSLGAVHFAPNGNQVVRVDLTATGQTFPQGATAVFKMP